MHNEDDVERTEALANEAPPPDEEVRFAPVMPKDVVEGFVSIEGASPFEPSARSQAKDRAGKRLRD